VRYAALALAIAPAFSQVTQEMLLKAQSDPAVWLSYGRSYKAWRYSELAEINTSTVAQLTPKWIYQSGAGGLQATPLVFDGMMYVTGSQNHAFALDLLTGRPIWQYSKPVPKGAIGCCGTPNRGFAALGNKLFKVDYDNRLVALDQKTGSVLWDTVIDDYKKGYSSTVAPLVVKNLVIVGIAGAEFGTRCFLDAYDADTGKRVWRFWTTAGPGEKGAGTWGGDSWQRGGGSTWVTGSYDPELNLIYWGTGNPGPDMNGDMRPGDNLYTCSLIALDADTGKLKWHYQFTPHDVHDWDATEDLPLVDLTIRGQRVKAIVQANRNGFYYALDRTTGELLAAKPYTKATWAKEIGRDGRPVLVPGEDPTEEGNKSCPGLGGGHNWQPTAYNPQTGLHYFGSTDGCHIYYKTTQGYVEGQWYQLSTVDGVPHEPNEGSVVAVDPVTAQVKWRFKMFSAPSGGMLTTGGGLVFTGDSAGYLIALDAKDGKALWKFQTGGGIVSAPVTYRMNGRQYLAVTAGANVMVFGL
jgi:alcohol dehydrogenase (cytochrome c)